MDRQMQAVSRLNYRLSEITADDGIPELMRYVIVGRNGQRFMKTIPYHGWLWRPIDFYSEYTLSDSRQKSSDGFIGFDPTRQWNLPIITLTIDERTKLNRHLADAVLELCDAKFQALYDFMQSLGEVNGTRAFKKA